MKKFLRLFALALTAATLTIGAASTAAHASPAPMTATMTVSPYGELCCDDYRVTVTGFAAMDQADAQRFIARPGNEASYSVWGYDDGFLTGGDDKLIGTTPFTYYWAAADGLHFSATFVVDRTKLNEDNGRDEVYAKVSLLDIRTLTTHTVKSPIISRYF
jgi:hypothetical protein